MTSRERVLAALNHQKPDRTPAILYGELIGYVPAIEKLLQEKCGGKSGRDFFGMDMTSIMPELTRLSKERFCDWQPEEAFENIDEWGVWWRAGSFQHFSHIESPLKGMTDFGRIKEYPWPDLDEGYRYAGIAEKVKKLQQEGIAVASFTGSVFEQAWYIRGMEDTMQDMMLNPEIAHYLFGKTAYYQKCASVQMAKAGCDMIMLGDDVAMQTGLLMSKGTWREFLKDHLAATIEAVKNVNRYVKVFYHSDGNIKDLIPELIKAGVDVLNPVQPECVDPAAIKKEFDKELAFLGTVSVQKTMPFGTPEEVKQEVKMRIETVGYDGGLVLAPAHVIEPEVPWENIVAFFEAVSEC